MAFFSALYLLTLLVAPAFVAAHDHDHTVLTDDAIGMPQPKIWLPELSLSRASAPGDKDMQCLKWQDYGCSEIKNKGVCLRSRDGRNATNYPDIHIYGSPCVWCGDGLCTSGSSSMCESLEYLLEGKEKKHFSALLAPASSYVATCQGSIPVPEMDYSCLIWQKTGCSWITEKNRCIGSRDGEQDRSFLSASPGWGQPCVWCGGSVCTDEGGDVCKNFDYLVNGQDLWYGDWHTRSESSFAACDEYGHINAAVMGPGPEYRVTLVEDLEGHEREGNFVTNGEDLWWLWQATKHNKHPAKHLVPEGDCEQCGCKTNVVTMSPEDLKMIPDGTAFGCDMLMLHADKGRQDHEGTYGGKPRFVTAGATTWWYDSTENSKHLVPADMDCSSCGCDGAAEPVTEQVLATMDAGSQYECRQGGILVVRDTKVGRQSGQSWGWIVLLLLLVLMAVMALTYWKFAHVKASREFCTRGISLEDSDSDESLNARDRDLEVPVSPAAPHGQQSMQDVFAMIDADGDGQITREEWQRYAFNAFDRNKDGQISQQEFDEARRPVHSGPHGPHGQQFAVPGVQPTAAAFHPQPRAASARTAFVAPALPTAHFAPRGAPMEPVSRTR